MDSTAPPPDATPPQPPPVTVGRRSFLFGGLAGGAVGLTGGAAGMLAAKPPGWKWAHATPTPQPNGEPVDPPLPPGLPEGTKLSYAQFGEDLVANSLFHSIGITKPTYLDVGAYEPIRSNNTYLFYRRGARGVLVEPNVALSEKIRRERPNDTLLVAGIGLDDAPEADYFVLSCDELNTFDRSQAERLEREAGQKIVQVVKMPLYKLNRVIVEHFGGVAPDLLSVDIEGLDFAVLRTLDYTRFRPKVICVETLVTATLRHNPETPKLLAANNYELRGMTYPNMFFMDKNLVK